VAANDGSHVCASASTAWCSVSYAARAGGLIAPFITHVLIDLVIVTIVLALVRMS
jgi:hypothetical protein